MLYEMFKLEANLWVKVGKSTNLVYATKRCLESNLKLTEYETGKVLLKGYEPPELVTHEDRGVRQLRKDPKWVASQLWSNA